MVFYKSTMYDSIFCDAIAIAAYIILQIYNSSNNVFVESVKFDKVPWTGPKAFVSEYDVTGKDTGKGSLVAALAEAGFLIAMLLKWRAMHLFSCTPTIEGGTQMQLSSTQHMFMEPLVIGCNIS